MWAEYFEEQFSWPQPYNVGDGIRVVGYCVPESPPSEVEVDVVHKLLERNKDSGPYLLSPSLSMDDEERLIQELMKLLQMVCRGFRLLAYDPCLWRAICIRRWPTLTKHPLAGDVYPPQAFGYATWRDMAIQKPHVLLDVVYYRGIRFYPDGRVSMLTSSHTPNAVVAALGKQGVYAPDYHHSGTLNGSTTTPANPLDGTMQDSLCDAGGGFLQGHYVLDDSNVRFKLASSKKRLHSVLHWDSYVIHTLNT
ncbi:F-box protein 9 [Paragonimus westermani]|uniref:F-box protein 9 n=1 Tax=Paragonimus westermani TaxID=34504 RepID=A0A5J4NQH2_9TREM|nr:F-box protein 9 [Paragonimus westermani]